MIGLVKQDNGNIALHKGTKNGSSLSTYMPPPAPDAFPKDDTTSEDLPSGTETILIVEDDANVLRVFERHLSLQGYNVLTAITPAEALRVCAQRQSPIHLLLTDVVLPGMGGRELAELTHRTHPGIPVVYMTGYPSELMQEQGKIETGAILLEKPFTVANLSRHVRSALDNQVPA